MNVDFSKWIEQGPMVCSLIIALMYFYRREIRMERKIDNQQKKCEDREERLVERLQILEDKRDADSRALLQTCTNVIQTNCRTFEQLTKIETDKFPSVDPGAKR